MPRRRGRPGLVGTMARTAVVAGTANAVVGAQNQRRAGKQQAAAEQQQANEAALDAQAQMADLQAQLAAQQSAPQAPAPADDMMSKLNQLASLHSSGVLSDEEFAAAKAKLLA